MDIEKLIEPFKKEDEYWSLEVLLKWLIEKKGISTEIAVASMQTALLELDGELKITTHHGSEGFDNYVLKLCRTYLEKIHEANIKILKDELNNKMKEHVGGGRFSKAYRSLRGKI